MKSKKGQGGFDVGVALALGFVVLVIVIAIGAIVVGSFRDTISNTTSTEYNVSQAGLSGLQSFGDLLPAMAVIAAVVVILILLYMVWRR